MSIRFNRLSPKGKRVAVARDAMQQLIAGQYKAKPGTYLFVKGNGVFKTLIKTKQCQVCAIGSLLTSHIKFGSRDTADFFCELDGYQAAFHDETDLAKLFDYDQLRVMEECFEQSRINEDYDFVDDKISYIKDPDVRLFAILENIIENDGEFVAPPDTFVSNSRGRVFREAQQFEKDVTRRFKAAVREFRKAAA